MKRLKGAISIFLLMIIISIYCLGGALVDLARYATAKSMVLTTQNAALDSSLTLYSKPLKDQYGIFAFEYSETLENTFEMHLLSGLHDQTAQSFYGFDIEEITLEPVRSLSEYPVLRRQILEYSKYRYSVKIVEEVVEKIKSLFKLMKTLKHFGGYIDVKQQECDLVEKDMTIQNRLHSLKIKGNKPPDFDRLIQHYQNRYPELVDEIDAVNNVIINLKGDLESLRRDLENEPKTISGINEKGEAIKKTNPKRQHIRDEIADKNDAIHEKERAYLALKEEQNQLIADTAALALFYEDVQKENLEIMKVAKKMLALIPPLIENINSKDEKLREDHAETEEPGQSIHTDYEGLKEKYNSDVLSRLITIANGNVDACRSIIWNISANTNSPPPAVDFCELVQGQVLRYSSDFDYYKPPMNAAAEAILRRSELKRFTVLFKELMQAIEDRITLIADSITGNAVDPLQPYSDYSKLPSYVYGQNSLENELKPYGKDVFKTKSSILGTDVEDGADGLDLFRSMGDAGVDFSKDDALENLLASSMTIYEEALINEYIIDHFNGACSNMQKNPDAYWQEGEIEYILYGSKKPRRNIQYAEASIFTMRLLPNTVSYFIFKKKQMDTAAQICSAPFPPMLPVLEVAFPILAGTVESLADVKFLHAGEAIPLFKLKDDLLLDFEFESISDVNAFMSKLIALIGTGNEIHSISVTEHKGNNPVLKESSDDSSSSNEKGGLSLTDYNITFDYEDYIRVLLFAMSFSEENCKQKTMRVADLMHMNLEKNIEGFNIGHYFTGLNSQVGLDMNLWFLSSQIYREIRILSKKQLIQLKLERGY